MFESIRNIWTQKVMEDKILRIFRYITWTSNFQLFVHQKTCNMCKTTVTADFHWDNLQEKVGWFFSSKTQVIINPVGLFSCVSMEKITHGLLLWDFRIWDLPTLRLPLWNAFPLGFLKLTFDGTYVDDVSFFFLGGGWCFWWRGGLLYLCGLCGNYEQIFLKKIILYNYIRIHQKLCCRDCGGDGESAVCSPLYIFQTFPDDMFVRLDVLRRFE